MKRVPCESSAGDDGERRSLTLPEFICATCNALPQNGWKTQDREKKKDEPKRKLPGEMGKCSARYVTCFA